MQEPHRTGGVFSLLNDQTDVDRMLAAKACINNALPSTLGFPGTPSQKKYPLKGEATSAD